MGRRTFAAAVVALLVTVALPAAAGAYSVRIVRTSQGVPHIVARDFGSLGYGYGYALAKDNICLLADTYTTVRGERSLYFGADGKYSFRGNGTEPNNLNSDFFYRRIIQAGTVEKLLAQAPPQSPRPEIRDIVRGYVAGYNRFLSDTGVDRLSDPTCRGKPWVKPITEIDAYRRFYQLALLASSGVAIDGIGAAQPPTPPVDLGFAQAPLPARAQLLELGQRLKLGIGSNAIALGRRSTTNGRGMRLGNPHFPWDGSERFYEAQLTVPGKLNVTGASLMGVPLILIGHNQTLAWSHTVSTAYRFTPYELALVPGSPTSYLVDGKPEAMRKDVVTVPTQGGAPVTRTLYSTRWGPMFTSLLGLPLFPWTPVAAFAMGDANARNFRYLNHFFETDSAASTAELDQVLRRNQGIPWVNTIAADSAGNAYYADMSVVPNVGPTKLRDCNTTALGQVTDSLLRLPVLDGSRSACAWDVDPDALQPGIFGPSHLPSLTRDDFVTNSNDSYWLSNPAQPLEGFARIIGDERTARALRTRSGLVAVAEQLAKGPFSLGDLQRLVFADRQHAGELWRDQLVAMCKANATLLGSAGPVDVSAACPVLAAWDLHDDIDSRGALLFRRFASRVLTKTGGLVESPGIFATPFSAADPVHTPRGLNTDNLVVRQALADAVTDLRSGSIPLNAPLRGYQYEARGDEKVPIHGGPGTLGVFNAINVSWTPGKGYIDVPHGSSFVMTVQFRKRGCPKDASILTYSQSTDPTSPHFADQTHAFSEKRWFPMRFCAKDLKADPGRTTQVLSGG